MKESLFAVFVCVLGCTEQQSLRQSECETNQDCLEEQWCDGRSERCMPTWTIDGSSASDGGSADIGPQRDIPTDAGTAESSRIDQRITPDAHSSESNDQSMAFDVSVPMDASGTDASGTDASGTEVSDAAAATEAPRPDQSIDSDMGQDTAVNLLVDPSFEDDDPNTLVDDNPMTRSGLILAGTDKEEDTRILASEAVTLDLDGTELVVLSACESGLGKSENGEGVYGIRRSLALAGAKSQVVSLWSVDDEATSYFMESFYTKIKEGKEKAVAMKETKLEMRGMEQWNNPKYWSAFVLTGEWQ